MRVMREDTLFRVVDAAIIRAAAMRVTEELEMMLLRRCCDIMAGVAMLLIWQDEALSRRLA